MSFSIKGMSGIFINCTPVGVNKDPDVLNFSFECDISSLKNIHNPQRAPSSAI